MKKGNIKVKVTSILAVILKLILIFFRKITSILAIIPKFLRKRRIKFKLLSKRQKYIKVTSLLNILLLSILMFLRFHNIISDDTLSYFANPLIFFQLGGMAFDAFAT